MKNIYFLLSIFSTAFLYSQTTLQAEIVMEDIDCKEESTTIQYQIFREGTTQTSVYVGEKKANCTFTHTQNLVAGQYSLVCKAKGYEDFFTSFKVNEEEIVNIETLYFYVSEELDEVTFNGIRKDFIKQEADKTIYTVENNEILNSGMAYETISKIPGIILTPEGYIVYNGQQISIWIDNQPSQLSGEDLISLLNSIPSNLIEKVEIIPNPGAAYDANTSGGIINIITKNKSVRGTSGSFNNTFRYTNKDNLRNFMNVNVNGRINKWSYQASVGNMFYNRWEKTENTRNFTDINPVYVMQNNALTDYYNTNYYTRTRLSYALSDNSSISAKFNYNQRSNESDYISNSFSDDINNPFSYQNIGSSNRESNNKMFNLNYRTKLDTLDKRLNANFFWDYYKSENFRPQTDLLEGTTPTYSLSKNNIHVNTYTTTLDASLPFSKPELTLELGGKYYFKNAKDFGNYNFNSLDISILENPVFNEQIDFDYDEQNLAFYTQLKKKFGNLSATLGVRMENFSLEGKEEGSTFYEDNFTNLFPSAFLQYDMGILQFFANYTRKVDLPTYSELNPNLQGYFDAFTSEQGNPNLKPRFYNNYEAKISFAEYLTFTLNYSQTENEVYNAFIVDGISITETPVLFDKTERLNFSFQVPFPFAFITEGFDILNRPNLDPDSLSYIVFFGTYSETIFKTEENFFGDKKPHNWWLGGYMHILLPLDFKLTTFGFYIPDGTFNQYQITQPMYRIDASIYKYFFGKDLKVSFSVNDLLNSYEQNIGYQQPNFNFDYYQLRDTQEFQLSLTWKIGKYKTHQNQEMFPTDFSSDDNILGE